MNTRSTTKSVAVPHLPSLDAHGRQREFLPNRRPVSPNGFHSKRLLDPTECSLTMEVDRMREDEICFAEAIRV